MKCALCENPLTNDERSRASSCLPVICDACKLEYQTNKLAAQELMREALTPGRFRDAIATLWEAARAFGPVELVFKNGELVAPSRLDKKQAGLNQPSNQKERRK